MELKDPCPCGNAARYLAWQGFAPLKIVGLCGLCALPFPSVKVSDVGRLIEPANLLADHEADRSALRELIGRRDSSTWRHLLPPGADD